MPQSLLCAALETFFLVTRYAILISVSFLSHNSVLKSASELDVLAEVAHHDTEAVPAFPDIFAEHRQYYLINVSSSYFSAPSRRGTEF